MTESKYYDLEHAQKKKTICQLSCRGIPMLRDTKPLTKTLKNGVCYSESNIYLYFRIPMVTKTLHM
jgi:hypothetical protein